jgi:uncharacterized protein DUF4124
MIVNSQERKWLKLLTSDFKSVIICTFFFVSFTLAMPLSAQVYKWVDENGKTHYSDKPHDKQSETVQIRKTPKLDPELETRLKKQKRLLEVMDEERQESRENKAAKAEEKRKRESNCIKARKNLQDINNASFLYEESDDPNNPKVYSVEDRVKATKDAEKAVQHWCN